MRCGRVGPLLPALAVALAVAACGGDDRGDIEQVLQRGFTTSDAETLCEKTFSDGFLDRVYGSVKRCRQVERSEDGARPKKVRVSKVRVDGDRATATVRLTGGTQAGATGKVTLADADGWRIDDLSTAFLRSQFRAGLRTERELDRRTRDCLGKQVLALDDDAFRELAYGSIGERPDAEQRLVRLLSSCRTGEQSDAIRARFEEGLETTLRKRGTGSTAIACIRRRLRRTVSDADLAEIAARREAGPRVQADVAAALTACRVTG